MRPLIRVLFQMFMGGFRWDTLGWVAGFCPHCRGPRPMRMLRLSKVAPWDTKVLDHMTVCSVCKRKTKVDPSKFGPPCTDEPFNFAKLLEQTPPELVQKFSRLSSLRPITVTREDRQAEILETLRTAESNFEAWKRRGFKRSVMMGIAAALMIGACAFLYEVGGKRADVGWTVMVIGLVIVGAIGMEATELRRLTKRSFRDLVPLLVPLDVTREELAESLETLRREGLKAGQAIPIDWLWDAVQRYAQQQSRAAAAGKR